MTDESFFTQLLQMLTDWIPKTASIAIADKDKYVVYRPGAHDIQIAPGDRVPAGSIADRVFSQQDRVESEVDASVFGIPYHGLGYPLRTNAGVEGALMVILPPKVSPWANRPSFVMGQADNLWRPIPLEEISFFESYLKKTWLHTENSSFTTNHTLQSLAERLPANQFLRIHRSYIVNISFIDFIQRDNHSNLLVTLKNSDRTLLPVAQTYVRHVRESLGF